MSDKPTATLITAILTEHDANTIIEALMSQAHNEFENRARLPTEMIDILNHLLDLATTLRDLLHRAYTSGE